MKMPWEPQHIVLKESATVANFATVQTEGEWSVKREIDFYNLDVIISVGYRVKFQCGTQFRIWATQRLNEYIRKGFTMDDERLKHGGGRYFRELLSGPGTVSHREAVEKAEHEFELYRAKEMRELESDFDRMIKEIEDNRKGGTK